MLPIVIRRDRMGEPFWRVMGFLLKKGKLERETGLGVSPWDHGVGTEPGSEDWSVDPGGQRTALGRFPLRKKIEASGPLGRWRSHLSPGWDDA